MSASGNLITGFLGAGKTTTILQLLAQRPAAERWAVLVNDFGAVGIDGATLAAAQDGIAVREVAGGCICCAANVPLRVAITRLLREVKPDRVLIEPTGLGHTARIHDTLSDEWLRGALRLQATLCVIDPQQFAQPELSMRDEYRDQIALADVIVINKTDAAPPEALEAVRAAAGALYPPRRIVETTQGKVDAGLLELERLPLAAPAPHRHLHGATQSDVTPLLDGRVHREVLRGDGISAFGWRFAPELRFARPALEAALARPPLARLVRAKGVFQCEGSAIGWNWTTSGAQWTPHAWRSDSRCDALAAGTGADVTALEKALLGSMVLPPG
jgi:G3E family GTPase